MTKNLRSGYTTGACAAAAAKGAALMLVNQEPVSDVGIDLPAGASAVFQLHGQSFSANEASCFVVKDAGDDPDITNGAEVHALVRRSPAPSSAKDTSSIVIEGGTGIGKVTKPGLAIPPGEWAINPVPRAMIEQAAGGVLSEFKIQNSKLSSQSPTGQSAPKRPSTPAWGLLAGFRSSEQPASYAPYRPKPGPTPLMPPWMSPGLAEAGRLSFPPAGAARWQRRSISPPSLKSPAS